MVTEEIVKYNAALSPVESAICNQLAITLDTELPGSTCKIWHAHPVWFLDGNPIAGYSKQKAGIRLMFWSGADFDEPALNVVGGKFKDASIFYLREDEINLTDLRRWCGKSRLIQWDYKNIVKRKGCLEKIVIQ